MANFDKIKINNWNYEKKDEYFMHKVLQLAEKGAGYSSPNPMVGVLVVKNGKVVGRGYHQYCGGPHAEVHALNDAGKEAQGAVLYVNLEPCSHYGKTPPCSLKIIRSGIKKVVIAHKDPNPSVDGGGIKKLRKAGIKVKIGVLADEARELNEVFLKYITTNLPFVYLKSAQTIDGFLACISGDSKWITSLEARHNAHRLRHRVDAVLVGIGTVLKDNPYLTTRLVHEENNPGNEEKRKGKDSLRIILDPGLKTSPEANIINPDSKVGTLIITGDNIEKDRKDKFMDKNVEFLSFSLNEKGEIPLKQLLYKLHQREISSILVEGGGRVNYSFLHEGLIDKYYFYLAPKILGGDDGVSVFSGKGPEVMERVRSFTVDKHEMLGDNLLIIGSRKD